MRRALFVTALAFLVLPSGADAATRWVVRGSGFGHGIGMSQFGAYGYAQHGSSYDRILRHYYRGTQLSQAATRRVRVLLRASTSSPRFRGATRLAGVRDLKRTTTYSVRRSGGSLKLYAGRKLVGRYPSLRVYRGGGVVRLVARTINGVRNGRFRGSLDIRPGLSGGVTVVNRLGIDQYVRGVVAGEMPSSWHSEALKVQAVAARSYALATRKKGGVFDLYPDTRSQVYQGVAGETRATNAAVAATAGQVVTYGGDVIVTYYFSTSGGRTENVENVFLGSDPKPWLKGVEDPYDGISPRHRWRFRFTSGGLDSRLGRYSPGRFRKIKVLRRGFSPRIVRARVYGTRGTRIISGPTLRSRLGLYDTWAYFTRVSSSQASASSAVAPSERAASARTRQHVLAGAFDPAPRGRRLAVERRSGHHWKRVATVRTSRRGSYRAVLRSAGVYRVRAGSIAGPAVRLS
jgi:SpoIID/LytB domain protein